MTSRFNKLLYHARLYCLPHGKMSIKCAIRGRFASAYKCDKQRKKDEELVALLPKLEDTLSGALALSLIVYKPVPKSFSKKAKNDALSALTRPLTKPDLSNVTKHVEDCITVAGIWGDDKQVVEYLMPFGAWYHEEPGYDINIFGIA